MNVRPRLDRDPFAEELAAPLHGHSDLEAIAELVEERSLPDQAAQVFGLRSPAARAVRVREHAAHARGRQEVALPELERDLLGDRSEDAREPPFTGPQHAATRVETEPLLLLAARSLVRPQLDALAEVQRHRAAEVRGPARGPWTQHGLPSLPRHVAIPDHAGGGEQRVRLGPREHQFT